MLIEKYNKMVEEKYKNFNEELIDNLMLLGGKSTRGYNILKLSKDEKSNINVGPEITTPSLRVMSYGIAFTGEMDRLYAITQKIFSDILSSNYYDIYSIYCDRQINSKKDIAFDIIEDLISNPNISVENGPVKVELSHTTRINLVLSRNDSKGNSYSIIILLKVPIEPLIQPFDSLDKYLDRFNEIFHRIKAKRYMKKLKKIINKTR